MRYLAICVLVLSSCSSLSGGRSTMTVAEALSIYKYKMTAYQATCEPDMPADVEDECVIWRNLLGECYSNIQAASLSHEVFRSGVLIKEMQTACDALLHLPDEVK